MKNAILNTHTHTHIFFMLKGEIADTKNMSSLRNMSGIDIRQKSRKNKKKNYETQKLSYLCKQCTAPLPYDKTDGDDFFIGKVSFGGKSFECCN